MLNLDLLGSADLDAYDDLVCRCPAALVYHTRAYRNFLVELLPSAEPVYLVARAQGRLVGALPAFIGTSKGSSVINSLPYFGSHGDVIVAADATSPVHVGATLINGLLAFARERRADALNLVSHPLGMGISGFPVPGLTAWDKRIGQVTRLTRAVTRQEALESVLAACSQKTRNLVRKGLRQGFRIERSSCDGDWADFIQHHTLGMERIGGRAKSSAEFRALRYALQTDDQIKLYVARRDDQFAGALLLLYHGDWVEYFTPVSVASLRNEQVLSAIIATAMCDAVLEGRSFWNWGGTWVTQAGVYRFKRGWGARDHEYHYYGQVFHDHIDRMQDCNLIEEFPFFYVRPFNVPLNF